MFSDSNRTNMDSVVLVCGQSADIQEFSFQAAKCSDMDCDGPQQGLFADCQEWHFQAANPSHKSSTILLLGRFAEAEEWGFWSIKR